MMIFNALLPSARPANPCHTLGRPIVGGSRLLPISMLVCCPLAICLPALWAVGVSDDKLLSASHVSMAAEGGDAAARLVEQLAEPEFALRRRAFHKLWELGGDAVPVLQQAQAASNRQVADSVNVLLVLHRLGIRRGDASLNSMVDLLTNLTAERLLELCRGGQWTLAGELLKNSEHLRVSFREDYEAFTLNRIVETALEQGELELAWPIITALGTAETTAWLSHRVGFPSPLLDSDDREAQVVQLYFSGEVERALELTQMPARLVPMTTRSFTWSRLADDNFQNALLGPRSTVATVAARAVLYDLAGDVKRSQEIWDELLPAKSEGDETAPELDSVAVAALEMLRDFGDPMRGNIASRNQLIVALLMAGQGDAVERYLEESNSSWAYTFYAARSRYDKAFAQLGLDAELSEFDQWLDVQRRLIPTLLGGGNALSTGPTIEAARVASALVGLGESEKAERLVRMMADVAKDKKQLANIIWQENIVRWLSRHESRALCMKVAMEYFSTMEPDCQAAVLEGLFPEFGKAAAALYQTAPVAAVERDGITPWQLLEYLHVWDRESLGGQADHLIAGWLRAAKQRLPPNTLDADSLTALAKTAIGMGMENLALEILAVDLAELHGSETLNLHWLTTAEIHLRRLEPHRALELLRSIRVDRGYAYQPAMVSEVEALRQLGEFDRADQLNKSRWVRMLGNPWYYGANFYEASRHYSKRGEYRESLEYAEPAFLFAETSGRFLYWAMTEYATTAEELDDHRLSANVLRAAMVEALQPYSPCVQFLISNGYISSLRYAISKERLSRAAACVKDGQIDEARRHLDVTASLQPLDIEAVIQCYPPLVEQGEAVFAEELFSRYEHALEQQIAAWPNDSTSLNNLAWMYSQCNRKLSEGKALAQRAVALSPSSPVFLDTLAELQYRSGQVQVAIESMRTCVRLDPRKKHYRENLVRFSSGLP
jgi:tetratricopeptide (TPR) repeat protein